MPAEWRQRTTAALPRDVHAIGRRRAHSGGTGGGGGSARARVFSSVAASPTANFLLAGAALEPGLCLLQNESYKDDAAASLAVDDVAVLDDATPVYDLAWGVGGATVLGASANGAVRVWTLDASNRVQAAATFYHNTRRASAAAVPPPGTLGIDRRVMGVRLLGRDGVRAVAQDTEAVSLWDLAHLADPVAVEKAPAGTAFTCVDAGPCLPHAIAIGAANGVATIVDTLGAPQSGTRLTFRPQGSDARPLRAVALSPLSPFWLATAGSDAVVRVWDTRFGAKPMRELHGHTVGVTSLAWSPSHGEWLCSGSLDQTMRLWSLGMRAPDGSTQHGQIAQCSQGLSSGVKSVAFCTQTPSLAVALSMNGSLTTMRCTQEFEASVASHRYDPETAKAEHLVERAVYVRDLADASKRAASLARDRASPEVMRELLRLCVPLPPNQAAAAANAAEQPPTPTFLAETRAAVSSENAENQARRRFEYNVFELAYYLPGDVRAAVSVADEASLRELQLRQRGNTLQEAMASGRQHELLRELPGIVRDLQANASAHDVRLLQDVFECVKAEDCTRALQFGVDVVSELSRQRVYATAVPLVHSLLFPTVFDLPDDQEPVAPKLPAGSLVSLKSLSTLCTRNPNRSIWSARRRLSLTSGQPAPASRPTLSVPATTSTSKAAKPSDDPVHSVTEVTERLKIELADADMVLPMLQTLVAVNALDDEISEPTDSDLEQLVDLLRGKLHFSTALNRLYFSALVRNVLERFDEYFGEAARVVKELGQATFARQLQAHSGQGALAAVQAFFQPLFDGALLSIDALEDFVLQAARIVVVPELPAEVATFAQQALRLSGTQYIKALGQADVDREAAAKAAKRTGDQLTQLKRGAASMVQAADVQHLIERLGKVARPAKESS